MFGRGGQGVSRFAETLFTSPTWMGTIFCDRVDSGPQGCKVSTADRLVWHLDSGERCAPTCTRLEMLWLERSTEGGFFPNAFAKRFIMSALAS